MKILSKLSFVFVILFGFCANAADISIYYSPTCPHCHHARDFISNNLIYEYQNISVTTVNVANRGNSGTFQDVLKKCGYDKGYVPVIKIGERCFQGFGDATRDEMRAAIEVDMDDAARNVAAQNRAAMERDAAAFRNAHAERMNAVQELGTQKKTKSESKINPMYFLIVGLVILMILVLTHKNKNGGK